MPVQASSINYVPVMGTLCALFQHIIEENQLGISEFSQMSIASKLSLRPEDFKKLLHCLNLKCSDEVAHMFFNYLLHQKLKLFKKLFPHVSVHLETDKLQKNFMRKQNMMFLPNKISYTDFLMFVQHDHKYLFREAFGGKTTVDIPVAVLALRVTIELFRVLCGDTQRLSINTLIRYVNKVENFPLTFPQLLQVLELTTEQTFQPYDLANYRKQNAAPRGEDHLKLRTYQLLDFIK